MSELDFPTCCPNCHKSSGPYGELFRGPIYVDGNREFDCKECGKRVLRRIEREHKWEIVIE